MNTRSTARLAALAITLLSVAASIMPAAAGGYYRRGTFAAGGGFNTPVSEAADYLNSSGTLYIGAGRNLSPNNTVMVEWTHNWLGIDSAVLERAESDSIQFDHAYASSWSMTLNLVHRFAPDNEIVPWVTGGIGYYKRNLQITQNSLVYYPPVWDPWWGWVGGGWGTGEAVTGSREDSGFGFNVGLGLDMEIENGAALFVDVRYHQANLDGLNMTLIPVMAGIRW